MLNKHVGAGPACPGAVDTHWNASVPKCGTLPKNAIFGKYVRRHLVSVEHRSFGLVHGKGVFYKCETPLGCKLQYKHLCSQRKKRSELLHTLPILLHVLPLLGPSYATFNDTRATFTRNE